MKAFIQSDSKGIPLSHNCYAAYEGFLDLGYEVETFHTLNDIQNSVPEDVLFGHIPQVLEYWKLMGITAPSLMDYPEELLPFMGRELRETTLSQAREEENWPVFLKPSQNHKWFTGHVIQKFSDLVKTTGLPLDMPVFASPEVKFLSEHRVYVLRGSIEGVLRYYGKWKLIPDADFIQKAIDAYISAPVAYSLDVGLLESGETVLVECNDFYSLGNYGLNSTVYAYCVATRWREIIEAKT